MDVNEVHPANEPSYILASVLGKVIVVNVVIDINAFALISSTSSSKPNIPIELLYVFCTRCA